MALFRLLLVAAFVAAVAAQPKAAPKANNTMNGTMDDHADHDHAADDHGAAGPMAKGPAVHGHGAMGHGGNMTMAKALPVPDSCVTAPTQGNCSTYDYPHANAANDLTRLCNAMSFMTGCSLQKACDKAGAGATGKPSGPGAAQVSTNADICKVFNHVATVCRLDTGMGKMGGCENLHSMCVAGSPVPKCKLTGVTALPTTKAVNAQVRAICEAKPTGAGCAGCTPAWEAGKTWANCDLLAVYSGLCGADPSLPQCVEYHNMCRADSSLVFCKGYNDAAKRVADSVLKNKGADADSKQDSAPAKSGSTAASSSMLLAALGVVAAVLVL